MTLSPQGARCIFVEGVFGMVKRDDFDITVFAMKNASLYSREYSEGVEEAKQRGGLVWAGEA